MHIVRLNKLDSISVAGTLILSCPVRNNKEEDQ